MGEPITLVDPNGEPFTVYGRHEAAVYLSQGYTYEGEVFIPGDDLSMLDGATDAIIQGLTALGLYSFAAVANVDDEKLTGINGVGAKTAAKLKASAAELL